MTALDLLLGALAPDRCLHCRAPADAGALLCPGCRGALPWLADGGCARCGLPTPCPPARCPARGTALSASWSPLAYEGPARSLALAGKARAPERVAAFLGAAMAQRLPPRLRDGSPVLVPVPADPVRGRRRGADHALLLARRLGRARELPWRAVLARPPAPARHRLAAGRRRGIELAPPRALRRAPPVVLLVDDVHTTGATLRACTVALQAAGAQEVRAVTAMRTLR